MALLSPLDNDNRILFLVRPYRGAGILIAHVMRDIREFAWSALVGIPKPKVQQGTNAAFAEHAEALALETVMARADRR